MFIIRRRLFPLTRKMSIIFTDTDDPLFLNDLDNIDTHHTDFDFNAAAAAAIAAAATSLPSSSFAIDDPNFFWSSAPDLSIFNNVDSYPRSALFNYTDPSLLISPTDLVSPWNTLHDSNYFQQSPSPPSPSPPPPPQLQQFHLATTHFDLPPPQSAADQLTSSSHSPAPKSLRLISHRTSLPAPYHNHYYSEPRTRSFERRYSTHLTGDDLKKRKRVSPEPDKDKPPLKSELHPPKQAPSTWQVFFADWLEDHRSRNPRQKLNVAQAAKEAGQVYHSLTPEEREHLKLRAQAAKEDREREVAAWKRTLTPEDIKRENAFRAAQRKAGKSRKGNLKDPNAPKKPLSAYFMFLQRIRSSPQLVQDVFGDETETTKQSVLAAAKWRSLSDAEKKPFLVQAEQEKIDYEAARRIYEDQAAGLPYRATGLIGQNGSSTSVLIVTDDEGEASESFSDVIEAES